jgi:large subunit ribosomal protein L25
MSSTRTTLTAVTRTGRGKGPARQIRMQGGVPCEVYGLGQDNQSVTVDAHDLNLLLAKGSNALITMSIDGGTQQLMLARQVNRHPVKGTLTHVDLIRVSADIAITADVAISLVGEAEGVAMGGLLEQQVFTLSISAKPEAIPSSIEHDISALGVNGQVRVGDLSVPSDVTVLDDPDTLVAMVSVSRAMAASRDGESDDEGAGENTDAAE